MTVTKTEINFLFSLTRFKNLIAAEEHILEVLSQLSILINEIPEEEARNYDAVVLLAFFLFSLTRFQYTIQSLKEIEKDLAFYSH